VPTSADANGTTDVDGVTALSAANFAFSGPEATDTLAAVNIATVTPTVTESATLLFDDATGHAYQFVAAPAAVSWADANAAATAAGGHLLVINSAEELGMIRDGFATATAAGLGDSSGTNGTWIGLSQAAGAAAPGDGWSWVSNLGVPNGGPAVAGTPDAGWNTGEPNDTDGAESGQDDWGALYQGTSPTDTALMYDWDASGLPNYIIEFESALTLNGEAVAPGTTVAADQLAGLSGNSLFNTGGTVTYTVTDSAGLTSEAPNTLTFGPAVTDSGPSQSISMLVEDPHLTSLA
jgi:hypothetical protein